MWPIALTSCSSHEALNTGTTWTIGRPLNANCERAPPPRDVAIERFVMPHHAVLNRVRAEYLEMPGLRLTPEQTGRLCGVERALCQSVLDALVVEKFLCVTSDGRYARVSNDVRGPPPAEAALRTSQHSLKAS